MGLRDRPLITVLVRRHKPSIDPTEYEYSATTGLMTDYHDNETEYTYTDRNQLSTLTAPGDKTWEFHYNELGQPTDYDIPNGMTCEYGYDARNRLTAIEYKDGSTVLDGFEYELDDSGNITKTTQEDGSYWDYAYDDRYRLLTANRFNSTGHVKAAYAYTYDDGDNMITKAEPFVDDFNDGAYSGWYVQAGTWSASNNYLSDTSAAAQNDFIWKSFTDDDHESRFSYRKVSTGTSENIGFYVRFVDWSNLVRVDLLGNGTARVRQFVAGAWSDLVTNNSVPVSVDTWYDVRFVVDGTSLKVYRKTGTDMETEILSATVSITSSSQVGFLTTTGAKYDIDDIWFIGPSLSNTTTFAVNNANELTSATDPNGTTSFGFDNWGRMTTKARGSYSATYGYKCMHLLASVTTDWPNESNATFVYGADHKRREATENSITVKYRWADGYKMINRETGSGTLDISYVDGAIGQVAGADPATGTYSYHMQDYVETPRRTYNQSKVLVNQQEYGPYGDTLAASGTDVLRGHLGYIPDHARSYP